MPRYRPRPAPTPEERSALPVHVLVRDWPELDRVFRAALPPLREVGHLPVQDALGGAAGLLEDVMRRMETETGWRPPADP